MNDQTLVNKIEDDIRLGVISFKQIAIKHDVSYHFVNLIWEMMCVHEFAEE